MEGPTHWLEGLAGALRCNTCGARFYRDDLQVEQREYERWLVRCDCHVCGRQGLAVVAVEAAGRRSTTSSADGPAPLTADDVLDAHDRLRDHSGTLQELLADARSP
jgi:hypothetical protein